jgi:hypothetical protein
MTTAVHRQRQMLFAGHVHHRSDVARVATSGDERRRPVNHSVEDPSSVVVLSVRWAE